LNCDSWGRYLSDLGVVIGDQKRLDHLLRFSVYNSWKKGYHQKDRNVDPFSWSISKSSNISTEIKMVPVPEMRITSISEAEKANAVLFVKPTTIKAEMEWIPPLDDAVVPLSKRSGTEKKFDLSSINAITASNDEIKSKPSGARKRFNLSSINSIISANDDVPKPQNSFSQRIQHSNNSVNSEDRFSKTGGMDLGRQRLYRYRFDRECGMRTNRVIEYRKIRKQ